MYKICAYAICKNERERIEQWLEYVKEADCVVVLDTGSTDGTYEFLQSRDDVICHQKIFEHFRFDVARNEALALVPKDCDICLPLDIDMILPKEWSKALRGAWRNDLYLCSIPQYFKANNCSGVWFAHRRNDVEWKYPVYELLIGSGNKTSVVNTLIIHDFNPNNPSHNTYMSLAELGVLENPDDPYCKRVRYLFSQRETKNNTNN